VKLPRLLAGLRRPAGAPPGATAGEAEGRAAVPREAALLARAEAYNRAAEAYWKSQREEPSARRHVLNKPFGTVTDAPGIVYRLGLLLSELRLGLGHVVLDFGAGSGWLASCLNRLGCRTVAVDVSPSALELARELFRLDPRHRPELDPRFLPYDGHRIPLPDASVDRVACFDAFHHVPNQDEVLREMHRVLRPGGRAVLAEPGEGHSHSGESAFAVHRHGVLENDLDVLDLERRARAAGFTGVHLKPYPDPDALRLAPADYVAVMEGDTGRFPVAALARSLRKFFLVTLAKGEERPDSRCPGRLAARIETAGAALPLRGRAGSLLRVPLAVANEGDTLWLHEEDGVGGYVLLSGHLLDADGREARPGFFRQALPRSVAPGERVEVAAPLPLPLEAGRYLVRLDLVDEHVMWFAQAGSPTLDLPLEVEAPGDGGALRARLEARGAGPLRAPGATMVPLRLRVTNAGGAPWPHAPEPRPHTVSLAGHLLGADGSVHEKDVLHQALPRTVAPGESVDLDGAVRAPLAPGRYRLKLDLVLEHVCWFEQRGSEPLELPLEVTEEVPDSASPGVLRASLEVLEPRPGARGRPGTIASVRLRATNLGNTRWLHAPRPGGGHVSLGGHLLDERRTVRDRDYLRAPLPRDVPPGEAIELSVALPLPGGRGRWAVELDLVDEGIAWFADRGSPTVTVEMETAD